LDVDEFNSDLQNEFSDIGFSSDANCAYNKFNQILSSVINRHVPLKQRKVLNKPVPFMNKALKQAIYFKRMLLNKFNKNKTSKNWEKYRKQRNLVTNLKRKSMNKYFIDRCVGVMRRRMQFKGFLVNCQTISY